MENDLLTDGPFAETYEQLGGYFLINAKDLDESRSLNAFHLPARHGEVRRRAVRTIGTAYKFLGETPCQTFN